jgi:uncharacterized caspase-like protein
MQGRWLWVAALVAAVLSIVVASDAARAQTPAASLPSAARNVALVIGNANYAAAPKLVTPVNSANAVAQMFRDIGFSSVDVVLDANRSGFEGAVDAFKAKAAAADAAVIYYAGHAVEIGGAGFLIPVDAHLASAGDIKGETIALQRLIASVADSRRFGLIMLDACRANPFVSAMREEANPSRRVTAGISAKPESLPENVLVGSASKDGAACDDGDGPISPYAAAIVKNFTIPGLDVRIGLGRIRKDVSEATGDRQQPYVYGSLSYRFETLGQSEENADQAKADFELVEKIGTRKAYEVFLGQHPTGPYAEMARERIKALDAQKGR